jgi:hypothetical protein
MQEIEHKISIPRLQQQAKVCATRGQTDIAAALREVAEELSLMRVENTKLKGTIREIRSIANLSIMRRL